MSKHMAIEQNKDICLKLTSAQRKNCYEVTEFFEINGLIYDKN